ncbi:ATP-binding protein [Thermoanaerobacterium sp. RBIITD]|uniref:sensor histidine kinase n=1 Tax=Thermoanaerobacterium sp. RBIITD TaxID=1550240 RepID=UPI000BB7896C|nr:ATP-binding protein [Thermoanaerobacterium sp. RBIITD]
MLKNDIRTRTAIAFVSIALISIIIFSVITNIAIITNFGNYIKQSTYKDFKDIATSLAEAYKASGNWNEAGLEISHNVMMKGYGLKVKDLNGKTILDFSSMMNMMGLRNFSKTTTKTLPVVLDGKKVGYVDITYIGTMPMNELDFKFLYDINKYNIFITILAILIAFLISIYISKYLTKPILNITAVAKKLENGNYNEKVNDIPKEEELFNLTAAINHLGESLKNQEMIRKQMTHNIAHELRTPLTTLKSHLEAMIDGIWEPTNERLISLHEEVTRLSNLINDLELLNKAESDILGIKKIKFNLSEVVKNILINYEAIFYDKKQTIVKDIDNNILIYADKDRISEVIINLITNANKYTQIGGNIKIKLYKEGNNVVFIIEDNGIGISKYDMQFIFEKFYRGEKSRNRKLGGSGLGLSISKAIIKAHNGTISVDSILNKGTKFTVKIPIDD